MKLFPIFWAVCAWAQSGIEVPSVGAMLDSSGALRPVQGVAGNFLLGPASLSGVLSAACSERSCLAKTDAAIVSPAGETDAPPGPAIFGLDSNDAGDGAVVYFTEQHTFARWHDNTLDPLDWAVDGEVLSIRLSGGEAEIAVRRDGSVWIVRSDGSVVDWIADTAGPVLLLPQGILFATSSELVFRRPDRSEVRFELTGAESIMAMGPHFAAIHAGNAIYALRTDPGRESLFLLPGTTP
jgi:hypothetical protein